MGRHSTRLNGCTSPRVIEVVSIQELLEGDEVVIDYDDNDLPCGVWIKKPHEIEMFDHDEHKDIVVWWDEGEGLS